jgi:putative (di)nucleoside polyphosphate hydrolase
MAVPPGGIESGEEPIDAVLREIKEETGIPRRSLHLLAHYPDLLSYELPRRAQSKRTGLGQVQYWFLFCFNSRDTQVRLPNHSAFTVAAWVAFSKAVAGVVKFKQPMYKKSHLEFTPAIKTELKSARRQR